MKWPCSPWRTQWSTASTAMWSSRSSVFEILHPVTRQTEARGWLGLWARSRKMCRSPNRLVLRYVEHRVTRFFFLVRAPSKSSVSRLPLAIHIRSLSFTRTAEQLTCLRRPNFPFPFVAYTYHRPLFVSLIPTQPWFPPPSPLPPFRYRRRRL